MVAKAGAGHPFDHALASLGEANQPGGDFPQTFSLVRVVSLVGWLLHERVTAYPLAATPAPVCTRLIILLLGHKVRHALASGFLGDKRLGDVLMEDGEEGLEEGQVVAEEWCGGNAAGVE